LVVAAAAVVAASAAAAAVVAASVAAAAVAVAASVAAADVAATSVAAADVAATSAAAIAIAIVIVAASALKATTGDLSRSLFVNPRLRSANQSTQARTPRCARFFLHLGFASTEASAHLARGRCSLEHNCIRMSAANRH
jgi:hypothetical protein